MTHFLLNTNYQSQVLSDILDREVSHFILCYVWSL